jgi:hypothetical protein
MAANSATLTTVVRRIQRSDVAADDRSYMGVVMTG